MFRAPTNLPISDCLDEIRSQLEQHNHLVLEAPPGAGKTTCVPLALLDSPWLNGQKILMLEPRRVAALNAAHRLAALLGESVGQTVGYRMRQATCVSAETRIEVITEGLLTRQLQSDPELSGIGAIIFDEFHERSIHSDTALAMALMARSLFREDNPLKLVVMSATLDGAKITQYLSQDAPCPQVTSQGRAFPVDIHYEAIAPMASMQTKSSRINAQALAQFIAKTLQTHVGSVLVFLPGAGEINKTYAALKPLLSSECQLFTLHGNLKLDEQQLAIKAPAIGKRKVVLATDIAETSLTIEGVRVVIDTGLARKPHFDPNTGLTRLNTEKIAKASAEQRAGRAGRTEPGIAYRLWSEQEHHLRRDYSPPEIINADLMPLALSLFSFGCQGLDELCWIDRPSDANWQQAIDQLQTLGAIKDTQLTGDGEYFAKLPCHPRLARLLITGYELGFGNTACDLAAIMSEKSPSELGCDLHTHVNALTSTKAQLRPWQQRVKTLAKQFKQLLPKANIEKADVSAEIDETDCVGILVACAFPERIAQRKHSSTGDCFFKLANGRQANISQHEPLAHEPYLAIAEAGGFSGQQSDRIFSAAALNPSHFGGSLKALCETRVYAHWEIASGRYISEEHAILGKLTLNKKPIKNTDTETRSQALLALIKAEGLSLLHWSDKAQNLRARMQFLHRTYASEWPDVGDQALIEHLDNWLSPALSNISHLNELKSIELADYLIALLPWPHPNTLNTLAPSSVAVASGRDASIDYSQTPPVVAVKLQEMFGCTENPAIANGAVKINIHLLSPNGRPLAMTGDIGFFWANAYNEVKKEMRGRYPKHPWPDDPINAVATAKTNRALRNS